MYPLVPLMEGMGLGIALFSYNGRLFWGFNADYALVPDLEEIPRLIQAAFVEFADSVGVKIETAPQEAAALSGDSRSAPSESGDPSPRE